MAQIYSAGCRACPRLAAFLDEVRGRYPDYSCRPVAPFGPADARFLIVGLAPGLHGANATGRPFTGDHAGIMLYETLHRFGFASAPESRHRRDGLELRDCRITNAVKCLPPQNKPVGGEISECNHYLAEEIRRLPRPGVILALGGIAHRAVLRACGLRLNALPFGHHVSAPLQPGVALLSSYHCSRYNTQTRRLTQDMFDGVIGAVRAHLDGAPLEGCG